MEDMTAVVSYVHHGDHFESDESLDSTLDHCEQLLKKPRLDNYESLDDQDSRFDAYLKGVKDKDVDQHDDLDEDEDMSSVYSWDSDYGPGVEEVKKIKRQYEEWSATIKPEDAHALLDTTGACILEIDANKLVITNPGLLHDLVTLLCSCRRRMVIYTFTRPGDHVSLDGGSRAYDSSELSDLEMQRYSTKARKIIQQYNETVNDEHSELEFASFNRFVRNFPIYLYITFTACQKGNGQIGTYQAALSDDCFGDEVQLVLLRHVESDKILAFMSISGSDEELNKIHGVNWNQ